MHKPKSKRDGSDDTVEANLIPIMNIMFLMIPALLLAMEFASMAGINVSPPRFTDRSTTSDPPPAEPELNFQVTILSDGFKTTAAGNPMGEGSGPSIPLRVGDPDRFAGELADSHDYAALSAAARELKLSHPGESRVTITAEGDVPMQTLVRTIDALRGETCKLGKAQTAGERVPDDCMFWQPIVSAT
ncbi:MAG: biopolymer transporter ExbD [Nannocystaceae bacterium]|nr:biopolymer transporter ExbD [Myxococcales bacterium]